MFICGRGGDIQLDISKLSSEEIDKCSVLLETMLLGLKNIEEELR